MDPQDTDIVEVWSSSGKREDNVDITFNAVVLSRALIKLLHSTTNPNPEDVKVTLKFNFYLGTLEIVENQQEINENV